MQPYDVESDTQESQNNSLRRLEIRQNAPLHIKNDNPKYSLQSGGKRNLNSVKAVNISEEIVWKKIIF